MADRNIDWESIERDYRAGILSVREIAASHGITHGAINKRSKRDSWDRDLSARIRAKAEALVSKAAVSTLVSEAKLATDREIVEANATMIARIRTDHRSDIRKSREMVSKLRTELDVQTDDGDLYEQLVDLISPEGEDADKHGKRLDALNRAMALPSRIKSMKDLAETQRVLIALEREAIGLDTHPEDIPPPAHIDPLEGARRIAFTLARAAQQQPTVH